ncbi:hypothetical protein M8013_16730 [Enterobacteriaceae bacterium H4N4]|uniref:Uncharacterized protein n=1 Tax=Silvania confinis TaxID=2926470 RepID=A0A9J6QM45_9ENTR|nr:hypothetical protein [Silvania confinis]MCU6670386.1 hypothetical protein [Silvania confinis]
MMPVDLSCIPGPAKRRAAPSFERWLVLLIVLIAIGGFVTVYFWPVGAPTLTATFWFCFLGFPMAVGGIIVALRWLVYLAGEWLADGWDRAREWDLAQDIHNGQRSLAMLGQVVHLPHVISAESVSQQLLMPDGITLPSQVDETGEILIHQASFSDVAMPVQDRVKERIHLLLTEASLQSAFQRLPQKASLSVLFQFSPDISVSPEERRVLQEFVKGCPGFPFNMTFVPGEGLQVVDAWLDQPEMMQHLLVIALNLSDKMTDGIGEAAVALLMSASDTPEAARDIVAEIHRPEQVKGAQSFNRALLQAVDWGKTTPEEIKHVWLTGTGVSNEATSLLSGAGVRFPAAGQPCDIDLKTGLTGCVSPWLAMAVAAEQAGQSASPQVVMCVPGDNTPPWFMTICPAAK